MLGLREQFVPYDRLFMLSTRLGRRERSGGGGAGGGNGCGRGKGDCRRYYIKVAHSTDAYTNTFC